MPGFLLSNVRSLRYKCDELYSIAVNNNSAVIAVSETWLNADIPDSTVNLPGYSMHRRDREGSGGGVALYVDENLTQIRLTHLEEDKFEALWVRLRPSRLPRGLSCVIAAVLYFPPHSSATAQPDLIITQYLDRCLRNIERNYQQAAIVILGDTNKYKSETICSRHGLKQIVAGATRKTSQLDSILTNISSMYESPEHLPPVGSSDHETILLDAGNWPTKPIKHIFCRKYTPETNRQLGLLMNTTDFSHILEATDPEAKVSAFTSTIRSILDRTIPFKKVSITDNDKPWMTIQIKDLIKDRQLAFCSGNKTTYSKRKITIAKKIKNAKKQYYIHEVEELQSTKPKQWFKSVKALMGMEGNKSDMVSQDHNIMQYECDNLAKHFASVWDYASHISPSEEEVTCKLSNCSIPLLSIGQVKVRLRNVKAVKAAGPDGIPPWMLKTFHEELAPVLCDIFNTCMQKNIFPKQWKEAMVKAVPKKTKPSFPADYRQISLLSCVGKVYEGILRDAILEDTVAKIQPSQHGFMANRSTDTALIHILQHWHEALNSHPKLDIHAVFVDFTRAFDTVDHCQLLYALADMNIRRPLWLSVRSYLSNREQKVKWGSCVSNSYPISAGVPQGGLLSPLLFVITINSLDSCLPPSVIPVKYADDLTITELLMGSLPGLTQKALDSVVEWGHKFSLAMNGGKTVDMVISARKDENIPCPSSPVISGHVISRVSTFKLLGVQISSDLSWGAHIKYMISKFLSTLVQYGVGYPKVSLMS
ncbi:hypothetical protein R3I94_008091 [Phoxinus phoxinus]